MTRDVGDMTPPMRDAFMRAMQDDRIRLDKTIQFAVICVLRTSSELIALYAQSRETLADVNTLRRAAGMAPITEEENKHPVTWTIKSKHLPDNFGKSHAVDLVCKDESGKITWEDKYYDRIGPVFQQHGFKWGVWILDKTVTLRHTDKGHFEWPD